MSRYSEPYAPIAKPTIQMVQATASNSKMVPSESGKVGQRIVEVVDGTGLVGKDLSAKVQKVFPGKDAIITGRRKAMSLQDDMDVTEGIASSVERDGFSEEDGILQKIYQWP